jgi:hypothetical protein
VLNYFDREHKIQSEKCIEVCFVFVAFNGRST